MILNGCVVLPDVPGSGLGTTLAIGLGWSGHGIHGAVPDVFRPSQLFGFLLGYRAAGFLYIYISSHLESQGSPPYRLQALKQHQWHSIP